MEFRMYEVKFFRTVNGERKQTGWTIFPAWNAEEVKERFEKEYGEGIEVEATLA